MDQVFKTAQGEVPGGHQRHQGLLRARPAGAGGHHLDRELRAAVGLAAQGEAAAPGAERQAARARGGDRGAGRPAEDGHHRHQHGRPRHRHRAGRQSRSRRSIGSRPTRRWTRPRKAARVAKLRERLAEAARPGGRAPAACTSSAPSATSRAASTTSCAAAPAARATPARAASICRSRIRCCASSPSTASPRSWIA